MLSLAQNFKDNDCIVRGTISQGASRMLGKPVKIELPRVALSKNAVLAMLVISGSIIVPTELVGAQSAVVDMETIGKMSAPPQATDKAVPAPTIDSDKNGTPDAWDRDANGLPDAWDVNGDGRPDQVDDNGDGQPDDLKNPAPAPEPESAPR
jgi:hypothetical protein